MATDRARRSYDASRLYRSVESQQGEVTVEQDANEREMVDPTTFAEAATGGTAPAIAEDTKADAPAPASASERAYGKGSVGDARLAEAEGELLSVERSIECQAAAPSQLELEKLQAHLADIGTQLEAMGDLSQEQSMRLQMLMERRAKFADMLSTMLKKSAETSSSIIANMK